MNCQAGDLAVIVSANNARGWAGEIARKSIGSVVRVIRLREPVSMARCTAKVVWEFEEPMLLSHDGRQALVVGCADSELRPIRDQPGADETLGWAPVPTTVPA